MLVIYIMEPLDLRKTGGDWQVVRRPRRQTGYFLFIPVVARGFRDGHLPMLYTGKPMVQQPVKR